MIWSAGSGIYGSIWEKMIQKKKILDEMYCFEVLGVLFEAGGFSYSLSVLNGGLRIKLLIFFI
jgi:hypothetical protein